MSRQDRLAADVDRGFTALEEGRLDDAENSLERAQRVDRKNPDVIALAAALADARGNVEQALALYHELVELTPDNPAPRICIARMQLHDQADPDAALATIEAAFDFIDEEQDLIDAVIVRTEALIAVDDLEDARGALAELATSVIDDPDLALDLAELALAADDFIAAKRWIEVGKQGNEADALHLLGRVYEAQEDRPAMIAAWKQVLALDAKAPPGPVTISEDELVRIAEAALDELPPEVHAKLERVPILIDDLPNEHLIEDDGLDPRLLGVFSGPSLREDGALAPTVTNILLFKKNLERVSPDLDTLAEEVRITVLHETAHYFGLDEDDLEKLGLD